MLMQVVSHSGLFRIKTQLERTALKFDYITSIKGESYKGKIKGFHSNWLKSEVTYNKHLKGIEEEPQNVA